MVKFFVSTILIVLSFAPAAKAADACSALTTTSEVIGCALDQAPEVIRASKAFRQSQDLEGIARQRPNPELSSSGTYGKSLGDNVMQINADLSHTVELGGKRSARIDKARGEILGSDAEFLFAKEQTITETLRSLYRLRQLESEAHTVDEALQTFGKILKQFKARAHLGPEQEVSYGVFQLAESDYRLRSTSISIERNGVLQALAVILGTASVPATAALPPLRESWPSYSAETNVFAGSAIKMPEANLKLSQAELELQKSESWPNVKIGPSYQLQYEGPINAHMFGANLTFTLPVFHANGGGRDFGYSGVARAEANLEVTRRELNARRKFLVNQYQSIIKALQTAVTPSEMETRHHNAHRLFERGIVPSTLVIEAHRQMVDFTKNRNEQELAALRALWELRALDGKLVSPENWSDL